MRPPPTFSPSFPPVRSPNRSHSVDTPYPTFASKSPNPPFSIRVYQDEGASPESVKMILFTFSRCCDPSLYSITPISAAGIIDEDWEKNCVLIVFPGGAANPYHRKLSELCGNSGNARIKEFVRNGGNYLGFCAGAYYGCHSIEFDKARSLEVVCNYELGFFDGKGVGPAMEGFDYMSARGSYASRFEFAEGAERFEGVTFFKGGPYFVRVFKKCKE